MTASDGPSGRLGLFSNCADRIGTLSKAKSSGNYPWSVPVSRLFLTPFWKDCPMFGALLELTIGVALAPVVIVADVLETPGKLIEGDTLFPVHTLEHIVDIVDRMEDSVL